MSKAQRNLRRLAALCMAFVMLLSAGAHTRLLAGYESAAVWPPPPPLPTPTPVPPVPYATFGNLAGINSTASAVEAVRQAFLASTPQDLAQGLLESFAETAIKLSATQDIFSTSVTLNSAGLAHLAATANQTRAGIEGLFRSLNYQSQRRLRTGVALNLNLTGNTVLTVYPSAAILGLDFIWVLTPYMDVGLTRDFLANNVTGRSPITINFSSQMESVIPHAPMLHLMPDPMELRGVPITTPPPARPSGPGGPPLWRPGMSMGFNPALLDIAGGRVDMRTYRIEFSRSVTDPIRLSVAPIEGARAFQVVRDTRTGSIQNTRTNRVTGNLDARIRTNGNFVVLSNEVNFVDTLHLSVEKQMAIGNLASQGILHGFSRAEFRPGAPITRAQTAFIISRMLGIYDPNASGGFTDVRRGAWYYGSVGSAQRAGHMIGIGSRRFGPSTNLPKDQLTVIAGRILRHDMGYGIPADFNAIVQQHYADWVMLPDWSVQDIALATRLGLLVPRHDNLFAPNSVMTRGEVALLIHRLYLRLW